MSLGKLSRLNRIFAHPSGRFCSVAVDHFIGYNEGLPPGLRDIRTTLASLVSGKPDAITMHKGIASSLWQPYAGRIPLILQSTIARPDDTACEQIADAEDAVRFGADAFAVAVFVRGATEAAQLRRLAECIHTAEKWEMPVICHIYPRSFEGGAAKISYSCEDIAWAVRCAVEAGVDVVKTPYCGDMQAFSSIISECPVPLVAAGGPRTQTLHSALEMMGDVVRSGARGATIGRNIWGFNPIPAVLTAFKEVIHNQSGVADALHIAGL